MRKFFKKFRKMILYMAFGAITMAVNFFTYFLMSRINDNTAVDTAVALVVSIVVAYVTNRNMVFESGHHGAKAVFWEFLSFLSCRLISGAMDIVIMVVFVDFLHKNDLVVKLCTNILVIALNYFASKWLVFKSE